MTLRSRISAARDHLPALRLIILLALSVFVTWYFAYRQMIDYFVGQGINPDKIGRSIIALEVFDGPSIFFSLLVFVVAGVIPITFLLVRADPTRSKIAQIVWATTIVGFILISKTAS